MLGPAFVWSSVAQGSGELIWWPYFAAKYGTAFIGILLPASLIQFWVNQETSRYTALTGEGIWSAFKRIGRWYSVPLFLLAFVSFLWFGGYASAGGTALFDLTHFPTGWSERAGSLFWAYLTMGVFVAAMFFSGVVYKLVETFMKLVTAVTLIGLLISLTQPEVRAAATTFFTHYLNPLTAHFPANWDPADASRLTTAIAYAGMGGFLNLMYSYWMRDKGVGMAARVGKVTSPVLKRKAEKIPAQGFYFEDTPENKTRWQAWNRYLKIDNLLAVGINAFNVMLTTWLALAVLHPRGEFPAGWKIAVVQARFFEVSMGPIGRVIFLIVAAAFMSDTWLGLADGVSRQFADFTYTHFKKAQKKSFRFWYYAWLAWLVVITALTMLWAEPGMLIVIAGVISIFAFVLYIPALYYVNHHLLPRKFPSWTRPSKLTSLILLLVWGMYLAVAIWYLRVKYFV